MNFQNIWLQIILAISLISLKCYLPLMLQQSKLCTHNVVIQTINSNFLNNLVFSLTYLCCKTKCASLMQSHY